MEKLVGVRYKYTGTKIKNFTVISEPRTGFYIPRVTGKISHGKSCKVLCECGTEQEVVFRSISNNYIHKCKGCGIWYKNKSKTNNKIKSKFHYWMEKWEPDTHKPCTKKLPYFGGGIGEEYIRGFCYVSKEDYERLSKIKWVKTKGYIKANRCRDNILYRLESIKSVFLHSFICGTPANLVTDHINRCSLDNRIPNLRWATLKENANNTQKARSKASQYKGVHRDKKDNNYRVAILLEREHLFISGISNIVSAAYLYDLLFFYKNGNFLGANFTEDYYRANLKFISDSFKLLKDRRKRKPVELDEKIIYNYLNEIK